MNFRNVIFFMVVATPFVYIKHLEENQGIASQFSPVYLMTVLENYGNQSAQKRPVSQPQDEFRAELNASTPVADLHLERPFLNLVKGSKQKSVQSSLEEKSVLSVEEEAFANYYQSIADLSYFDVEAFLDNSFTGSENADFMSQFIWSENREPAVAEKLTDVEMAETRSSSADSQTESNQYANYPDEITPGRYRVVDNLGFVTEVVITDADVDLLSNKNAPAADHYVLHQGPRTVVFVRLAAPMTARKIQYWQMYNQVIAQMQTEHLEPLTQLVMQYAMPSLEMAETSLKPVTEFAQNMWQEVSKSLMVPTRLSTSPTSEELR